MYIFIHICNIYINYICVYTYGFTSSFILCLCSALTMASEPFYRYFKSSFAYTCKLTIFVIILVFIYARLLFTALKRLVHLRIHSYSGKSSKSVLKLSTGLSRALNYHVFSLFIFEVHFLLKIEGNSCLLTFS